MLRRLTQPRVSAGPIASAACAMALASCPGLGWASVGDALSGGAGIDYQTGPHSQSYRGVLLFASGAAAPGDLTLAAIRYDDSRLGPGIGGFASAGAAIAPGLRFRVIGLRTLGDQGFDAWRFRAGPELKLGSEAILGGYYLRLHDDSSETLDAAGVELSVPLSSEFSTQVGSSYGRWTSGETTAQVTIAGTHQAGARLLLLCELDVGRNVTTTSSSSSSGGGIVGGLPDLTELGTSGTSTQSRRSITSTTRFGIRFLIP